VRRVLATLVALGAVVLTTGCDESPLPDNRIEVDTPELVKAKAEAGVEDCVAVSGSPVDGGMPPLTLPCLGGGPDVDVSSLRGPMLISLWAYWCAPCREEMPILQAFHDKYADQVPLLGIDYQDTMPGGALALMDETGATYPSLADPYGELSARGPLPVLNGLPYLLFIDADGAVTAVRSGEVHSEKELVALVEQHLEVRL
jgi:thiol-disulfide isomerase/thioredoxin